MKDIDIRVRIMLLVLVSIGILFLKTEEAVYAAFVFTIIWSGSILGIKKILPQVFLFIGLELILILTKDARHIGNLPLLIIYLRRLIIAVITAYPVSKAPTGKLIASLDKLKVPRTATISLAVLFRFLPTVTEEYSAIRRAQRYRNIGNTIRDYIVSIPQLFEYTMVPLLIRTTKVADELTASAEVRGMKLKGKYNSYYEVKMKVRDCIALSVSILYMIGICYMDYILRIRV